MSRWRPVAIVLCVVLTVPLLAYLRDPPWLIDVTSGFGALERDRGGRFFRWIGGRASFFVPAGARQVQIPVRALFLTSDRRPFLVRIDVNDRPVKRIALEDEGWREVAVQIPAGADRGRRVVRIDLHVDHTWSERSLGVQVGQIATDR